MSNPRNFAALLRIVTKILASDAVVLDTPGLKLVGKQTCIVNLL